MLNETERNERLNQLGASDIHKIFNFNNKGALDLWMEKMGLLERKEFDSVSMNAGNLLEEDCLKFFFDSKNIKDYTLNRRVEHSKIENFVVSLDGEYSFIPVENKTIRMDKFAVLTKPERNHYLQIHAQMACLNSNEGYIVYNAVKEEDLENPLNYKPSVLSQEIFHITADKELIQEIESRASYFLWCLKYKRTPSEQHYLSGKL